MKYLIKGAVLLCMVTILLSAPSSKTTEAKAQVPLSGGPSLSTLSGVAAVSASDIWAVGNSYSGKVPMALIEQWDGNKWSVVKSPNVGSSDLSGVAVVSANDVWAVGSDSNGTLIEHWNGTQWSNVKSPNLPGSTQNGLSGVVAVSANDVWAVGGYGDRGISQTLVEHWNGHKWSVVKSANPGSSSNSLVSVAAVSANDIWAVGTYDNGNGPPVKTLIEHWNGTQWSIVKSPNPGSYINALSGVAVVSANDVWAVGGYSHGGLTLQTLIEHWNGTQWSIVKSPNPGSPLNGLHGVAVVTTSDIWAVGEYDNSNGHIQTLIEHWNGKIWSVVKSPNPGSPLDELLGVAAVSAKDVWAVGVGATSGTLIEHWNGKMWSIVPGSDRL